MTYGRLEDTFHDSVKVERLAETLGVPVAQAAGHLAILWSWALVSAPDGDVSGYRPAELERRIKWTGAPGALWAALTDQRESPEHRFLDPGPDGQVVIHDWWEHAEGLQRAHRKRAERARKREVARRVPDAAATVGSEQSRSDQSREERSRSSGATNAPPLAEPGADAGSPTQVPLLRDVVLLEFPATGGKAASWPLTESVRQQLELAYPAVDVLAEARMALAWVQADPKRRKTPNGYRRFLTAWLSRAVDGGRYASRAGTTGGASARERLPDRPRPATAEEATAAAQRRLRDESTQRMREEQRLMRAAAGAAPRSPAPAPPSDPLDSVRAALARGGG